MEDTKEFDLDATKAVRFEGIVWRAPSDSFVEFSEVKGLDGTSPLALIGEGGEYVGMVKLSLVSDLSLAIKAQGLLDYGCAERLILETEELGLAVEVWLGGQHADSVILYCGHAYPQNLTALSAKLKRVPSGCAEALKQVPMSWLF